MGNFIIGPFILSSATQRASNSVQESSIRPLNLANVLQLYKLLYYLIYNQRPEQQDLVSQLFYNSCLLESIHHNFYATQSRIRQNDTYHHSIAYKKKLLDFIRKGDQAGLSDFLTEPIQGTFGTLALKNPLRSLKNLCIASIILCTRAAIDAGLDSDIAYTLSDCYIQQIILF